MVIEYGPSTTAGAYDLKQYLWDTPSSTPILTHTTAVGSTIFNARQGDPVIGSDTWMYIDDLKVFNTTFNGTPP
jgi:hypothetical protein